MSKRAARDVSVEEARASKVQRTQHDDTSSGTDEPRLQSSTELLGLSTARIARYLKARTHAHNGILAAAESLEDSTLLRSKDPDISTFFALSRDLPEDPGDWLLSRNDRGGCAADTNELQDLGAVLTRFIAGTTDPLVLTTKEDGSLTPEGIIMNGACETIEGILHEVAPVFRAFGVQIPDPDDTLISTEPSLAPSFQKLTARLPDMGPVESLSLELNSQTGLDVSGFELVVTKTGDTWSYAFLPRNKSDSVPASPSSQASSVSEE